MLLCWKQSEYKNNSTQKAVAICPYFVVYYDTEPLLSKHLTMTMSNILYE